MHRLLLDADNAGATTPPEATRAKNVRVVCFINTDSRSEAITAAKLYIGNSGWRIRKIDDVQTVDDSWFPAGHVLRQYYEQAKIDGEVFVFITAKEDMVADGERHCDLGRAPSMNEAEFEGFLADAVEAVQSKNDLLSQRYGIGQLERWEHNGNLNQLTIFNPGDADVLIAETTDIGSYAVGKKTWLWAWANESTTDAGRAKADNLRKLFDITGMRVFSDDYFDCDEYLAWELAAASVQHLGGIGCYRGPRGDLWRFWSIDTISAVRRL